MKRTITDDDALPIGAFAVMRHSGKQKRMHFSVLHDTQCSAEDEAKRLMAEGVAQYGPSDACYYVVKVLRQIGIVDGVLRDAA